jgi:uncharacterized protein (DUF305 family)
MPLERLLPIVALLAFVGAACGDDGEPGTESGAESGVHDDADVAFATAMVPHHEQAVSMAKQAATRASRAEVKELASRIEAAQAPEIATMKGWLAEWGEDASADMGMDMGGMEGMMSEEEMGMLESVSGAEFDRTFLEMMIRHHDGAVTMAEAETEDGAYGPAKRLAGQMASSQRQEIDEMKGLLAALG